MNNKKLITILTLVCFLFTLMPVAAFADTTENCDVNCPHEAKIGATHYDTLDEAWDEVDVSQTIIVLKSATVENMTLKIMFDSGEITLDLNGNNVILNGEKDELVFGVASKGQLVIKNGTANNAILNTNNAVLVGNVKIDDGVIINGTITATSVSGTLNANNGSLHLASGDYTNANLVVNGEPNITKTEGLTITAPAGYWWEDDKQLVKVHTHEADTAWKSDADNHWNECTANDGVKMNEAAHTFEWVIDREATKSEIGLKHEECTVCGYTRSANTEIAKLPSANIGGGGFSGSYNYPINVTVSGADVTLSDNYAVAGETVTITVTPDSGKQVDEVIVTDADGDVITVTKVGDNQYSFTMPAGKVNVTVTTTDIDYGTKIVLQIGNKNVLVNTRIIRNDVAPVIQGDRTLVPIRVIVEALGGDVDWDEATRTVTLTIDGKVLTLVIDKMIPGFGQGAAIMDSRTYVPIRYVAEYIGANVEWIAETQQIVILK